MSHEYIVKQSEEICKCLNQLRFRKILSDVYMAVSYTHLDVYKRQVYSLAADALDGSLDGAVALAVADEQPAWHGEAFHLAEEMCIRDRTAGDPAGEKSFLS